MWQVFNVKVVGTGVGTVGGAIIRLSVGLVGGQMVENMVELC